MGLVWKSVNQGIISSLLTLFSKIYAAEIGENPDIVLIFKCTGLLLTCSGLRSYEGLLLFTILLTVFKVSMCTASQCRPKAFISDVSGGKHKIPPRFLLQVSTDYIYKLYNVIFCGRSRVRISRTGGRTPKSGKQNNPTFLRQLLPDFSSASQTFLLFNQLQIQPKVDLSQPYLGGSPCRPNGYPRTPPCPLAENPPAPHCRSGS